MEPPHAESPPSDQAASSPANDVRTEPLIAFTEQWMRWWQFAGGWGPGRLTAVALLPDARKLRRSWLADLTRATDLCLRSPEFLELMQTNLRLLTGSSGTSSPTSRK